ncbi:Kelch motif family protein [Trichomonas vaginalis G3]|uniref:Kelch motif family protein n=1 Tax=Trichomonas vaginalis (strain ATCC PRA-98 / G3) TaxID=412133 RepID=A2EYS7_TRIV3|nr:nitrile biosynthetic process [Trichomonas vaginalis G3]EAY02224.1 Kelch motif family protein [Trichomonas vaginalis G3]KAI5501016.1 nitrile biosynthetic process [Trichomonas vaginalis G3]|eukprot:XP_001314562.1 Kelch motif family protein [Trichomonas vaginalis G3]
MGNDHQSHYYARFGNEEMKGELSSPFVQYEQKCNNKLLKMSFYGLWSVYQPYGVTPTPRVGHFHSYDPDRALVYVGYGCQEGCKLQNDVWALETTTQKWHHIEVKGYHASPRTGCSGVFWRGHILVYGGYTEEEYVGDLHAISCEDGNCEQLHTTGEVPPPRQYPILGVYENRFYVWGGYNGTYPSDLYVLDLDTLVWKSYKTNIQGRSSAPYTVVGSDIYSYGGSKTATMLHIDMTTNTVEEISGGGSPPQPDSVNAGMAATPDTIYWFGAIPNAEFGFVYAYDISRKWWFIFHVRPDGDTVGMADGRVDSFGLFQLPLIQYHTMQYESRTRTVLCVLGTPLKNPPPTVAVQLGDAIPAIHLRQDMLDALPHVSEA